MIQFRASSAGNCTRQIVLKQLEPGRFETAEARRPFLDAGHYLQEAAEAFILAHSFPQRLLVEDRESEGFFGADSWTMVGHIDGVFEDGNLLEVKAIKDHNFEKLAKTYDWRDQYGHYQPQSQCYQHMFTAPGSHFVYYNRNTSDMMGSLPIEHPAYTFRKDMYEPHDPSMWKAIMAKFDAAARYVEDGEAPAECDAKGYCWFCGVRGTSLQQKRVKRVGLLPDDDEYQLMTEFLSHVDVARSNVAGLIGELEATEVSLLHQGSKPEIIRKEDYEL